MAYPPVNAMSLLLACLGIFGLTSITLGRRVKELGIRKVLGAGAVQVLPVLLRAYRIS